MPMRHGPKQRGFTIIEVLIFLAISGFVFASAIGQYTSQQKKVNFNQGVRDLQALLSTVSNEAESSYGPDVSQHHCTTTLTSVQFFPPPGDSSSCIFLGKAFAAGYGTGCSKGAPGNCTTSITIPVVGAKSALSILGSAVPVNSYAQAFPLALTGGSSPYVPDLPERKSLNNNIGVYRTFVRNNDGSIRRSIGAVAFLFNLDSTTRLGNALDLVGLPLAASSGEAAITQAINGLKTGSDGTTYYRNPVDGITFCIEDGNGKLSAISVGAGNSSLDVQVETAIDSGCN